MIAGAVQRENLCSNRHWPRIVHFPRLKWRHVGIFCVSLRSEETRRLTNICVWVPWNLGWCLGRYIYIYILISKTNKVGCGRLWAQRRKRFNAYSSLRLHESVLSKPLFIRKAISYLNQAVAGYKPFKITNWLLIWQQFESQFWVKFHNSLNENIPSFEPCSNAVDFFLEMAACVTDSFSTLSSEFNVRVSWFGFILGSCNVAGRIEAK